MGQPAAAAGGRRGQPARSARRSRPRSAGRCRRSASRRSAGRSPGPRPRCARSSRRTRTPRPCPATPRAASVPGVSRNLSTATSAANFCRSLRSSGSFSAVSRARVIALSEEMKTVDTKCVPSRARTIQAALSASTVREASVRCALGEAGQADHGPGHDHRYEHQQQHRADQDQPGRAGADRVLEEADPVVQQHPVEHRVERAGQGGVEADVDDLDDAQHAEQHPADHREHPAGPARHGQEDRDAEQRLDRDPDQRLRGRRTLGQAADVVRGGQREEDQHRGRRGDHAGEDPAPAAARGGRSRIGVRRLRRSAERRQE